MPLFLRLVTCFSFLAPPPTPVQCSEPLDVMFVVDSSSSVGTDNFQLIRDFLSQASPLINAFPLLPYWV